MALMRSYGMIHALALRGKGFVYRIGFNRYKTFNKLNPPPYGAELIACNEFKVLRNFAKHLVVNGTINGISADAECWEDNGLYITCVSADIVEMPDNGQFSIITGQDIHVVKEVFNTNEDGMEVPAYIDTYVENNRDEIEAEKSKYNGD